MAKQKPKPDASHVKAHNVEPSLRMFANCSQDVNEARAQFRGNLAVSKKKPKVARGFRATNLSEMPAFTNDLKKQKKFGQSSDDILVNVFVELTDSNYPKIEGEFKRNRNLASVQLPLTKVGELARRKNRKDEPAILSVEMSRTLKFPEYRVVNNYGNGKDYKNILRSYQVSSRSKEKVLIGIIDVGGFDFSHPEFLDKNGNTRFLEIWDQGGEFRAPKGDAAPPKDYPYGTKLTQKRMNTAVKVSKKLGIPPYMIEKQSQVSVGSHGTHVASIAAGNNGVCPDADIVAVLISLSEEDLDRRKSFYDSSRLIHAVDYLLDYAKDKQLPISINISLGTNGHAHDGTDIVSRWIDAELSVPGRCITIAAGNSGQESPGASGDLGFTMGRIHTSGKIEATGLEEDILWNVVGNKVSDVSENELEVWYEPQDRFSVMLKPPGLPWIGPVKPNEFIENEQISDGSFISIYNDLYHPSNGLNYASIFLSPNLKGKIIPIRAGEWTVRLIGTEIRNGEYHAWIERDDPRPLGPIGDREAWNFPSFFSLKSNVDNTSISSLACARSVISVGNLDHEREIVNESSSQGPTRDKRLKPEVIAPGSNITAAKGFSSADDLWISMTGTSMAAPIVCGVAANMLRAEKTLTAAQISGIMVRTSKPLPSLSYSWRNDCGFGVLDARKCLEETMIINKKSELK
jgi:subtilisin family serine protease